MDMIEIDAASNTGVDDVREVIENAQYTPSRGRFKVYLIDEVHMLSKSAFNALLKTLEEPPEHVKFLLATTDPQKLPVTVLSRCLKFNLKRLLPDQIGGQMQQILQAENVAFDAEALAELARGADGSLRDGLSLLDQAIAYGGGSVHAAEVRQMLGTIERGQVFALLEALRDGDGARLMAEVDRLAEFSPDFGAVLDEIAAALHRVQLKQLVAGYATPERSDAAQIAALAAALAPESVQLYYQIVVTGRRDLALAPTPRAGFEMTLLRLLAFRPQTVDAGAPRTSAPPAATSSPAGASAAPAPSTGGPSRSAAAGAAAATIDSTPPPRRAPAPAPAVAEARTPDAAPAASAPNVAARSAALAQDWPSLIKAAGLGGPVGQLAQHAALLGIESGLVRLALKPEFESLSTPMFIEMMEQKLGAALGQNVKVKFEKASSTAETPADIATRERASRQSGAERAFESDPTVQTLMRDFDARSVPQSIKPV